jgi:hypothetical protein
VKEWSLISSCPLQVPLPTYLIHISFLTNSLQIADTIPVQKSIFALLIQHPNTPVNQ